MRYTITYSQQASNDIDSLHDVIAYDYSAPLTAKRYLKGIYHTIESLSRTPQIMPSIGANRSVSTVTASVV